MMLEPTYYDFIRKIRSFVVESAEQDAQALLDSPIPTKTIISVDNYQSNRYQQCVDSILTSIKETFAQRSGLSADDFNKHINNAPPDIKAHLATLLHTVNYEYHALVNFALAGKKTFHFSNNLSEHLANTEINIKTDLVELPFETCLFVFTSPVVINAMHNILGDKGRWDMNVSGIDYSAPVSVFATMHPGSEELPGRTLVMLAWHARQPNQSYLMLKRELYMEDGWTLEQALRTDWAKVNPEFATEGLRINAADGIDHQDDKTFYTDGLGFYRIILNAILYLSSDQPELIPVKSPRAQMESLAANILSAPKRKKVRKEASRHSELDYSEVGASVGTIIIQQSDEETIQGKTEGHRNKSLFRFMVRGHWRHQPCGAGLSERKLIWIRPFYKGADIAKHINKPYLVK